MNELFCIVGGGSLGALSRYLISEYIAQKITGPLPWGTIFVNLTGSLLIGIVIGLIGEGQVYKSGYYFTVTGFLGAYTTFSAYSLETAGLIRERAYIPALLNFSISNLLSLILVFTGIVLARFLKPVNI